MTVTKQDLTQITSALDQGNKKEAIMNAEKVLDKFYEDINQADTVLDYTSSDIGAELQKTIHKVRTECAEECQNSNYEALRFTVGDRVYGFCGDETATIFLLAPYLGEGNLIIDHLNDHYRENTTEPDFTLLDEYDSPYWKDDNILDKSKQLELINSYIEFYQTVPKLNSLPRRSLDTEDSIEDSSDNDLDTPEEIHMVDRACKAGLLKTLLQGNKIHFNIDRYLNHPDFISQPAEKLDTKPSNNPIRGFYTAKELRFTKRLNDSYPGLMPNLKFYELGKEVTPPWDRKSDEWKNYPPKENPGVKSTMQSLASSNNPTTIQKNALILTQNANALIQSISNVLLSADKENSNAIQLS